MLLQSRGLTLAESCAHTPAGHSACICTSGRFSGRCRQTSCRRRSQAAALRNAYTPGVSAVSHVADSSFHHFHHYLPTVLTHIQPARHMNPPHTPFLFEYQLVEGHMSLHPFEIRPQPVFHVWPVHRHVGSLTLRVL